MTVDVVFGSALWYSATKVNTHFVAERLAREVPVLFVESVGSRRPGPHDWRRSLKRLGRTLRPLRRVADRLWVFSPVPLPLYRGRGARANSRWVGWQVRALLAVRGWRTEVCWVFHPMGLGTARAAHPEGLIYYCVDDYAANPGVDAVVVRELEGNLARSADLTIVTAEPLATRLRSLARDVRVLPNVADTELFGRDFAGVTHDVLRALDAIPRPRIGYLGNLATYKIDVDLIRGIAERRPDWSVVLVGPRDYGDTSGRVARERFPSNVHVLDPVPHDVTPAVIDRFDVCLLPGARHDVMKASFPLKFFEYLLRGKPVVSRPLPALELYREWYGSGETPEMFVTAVEHALARDEREIVDARRRFASGFGWDTRTRELLALRDDVIGVQRVVAGARR